MTTYFNQGKSGDVTESLSKRLSWGVVCNPPEKKRTVMSGPLRVLHVLSQQPGKTGSGVYLQALVTKAFQSGILQHVIAGLPADSGAPELLPLDSENITPVYFETDDLPFSIAGMSDVMPYKSTRFSSFTPEMLEKYLQAFSSAITLSIRQFQPHLIHTHHLWLVSALTRILNPELPVVTTCHGTELRQLLLAPQLKPYVIPACSKIDRVFALHTYQVKQLASEYHLPHDRIEMIGSGFRDDIFFRDLHEKIFKETAQEILVVYAGKISRAKGVPWLIDAMRHVTIPEDHTVRLILAGSSGTKEGDDIISTIGETRCRISYAGPLSQNGLADLFKTADVFVLPSFYEGLPLVLLEALACGCRIVVNDLPGLSSWLPEKLVGAEVVTKVPMPRLIQVDEPHPEDIPVFQQHLADAISFQLKKATAPASCQPDNMRSWIKDFTWENIFAKIEHIYQNLCSGK